jgi:Kef-type K+ transport system membrane component KefB
MVEAILTKFLIILAILFFIPKVIYRIRKIPYAITEIILGVILALTLPLFFYIDDTLTVLSAIGIITIFISGGMEADLDFIIKEKSAISEILIIQTIIVVALALGLNTIFHLTKQISILIALALATPSAGYVFSFLKSTSMSRKDKQNVQSVVVSLEILNILLLLVMLNLGSIWMIIFKIATIIALILLLPILLHFLYQKIFQKVIGAEFGLIFVIALLSAFATDYLGVHFIIGAFVAGIVSIKFLDKIKSEKFITSAKHSNIIQGFTFFAAIFAPFYFFMTGLMLNKDILTLKAGLIAISAVIVISALRYGTFYLYGKYALKERQAPAMKSAIIYLPTLVFTFVIAEILRERFDIAPFIFGALLIYGILTSIIPMFFMKKIEDKKTN